MVGLAFGHSSTTVYDPANRKIALVNFASSVSDRNALLPLTLLPSLEAKSDAPGIFQAIQEQLGLKLVPAKRPLDVLVIDHIERPSQN